MTDHTPLKRCGKCGLFYPATNEYFKEDKRNKDGLTAPCRACRREYSAIYRTMYPDKVRVSKRNSVQKKPDKYRDRENKWRELNKEKLRIYCRDRRLFIPDENKRATKKWRDSHKMTKRIEWEKRRARQLNAPGSYSDVDVFITFQNQDERCAYCGIRLFWNLPRDIHIDHIEPLSKNGTNWPDNLAITCSSCNPSKGDKTIAEWVLVRGW